MAELEDQALMARVQQGDERAFLALYDRYAARVHALCWRILADPLNAEEATQDVFLKLWSRAAQYQADRGGLLAWLLTIARRTALDRWRREARRPALTDDTDPEAEWQDLADGRSSPDEARWRSLQLTVQTLPPDLRQAVELAYYYGLSQSEIAETLGWPLGTVKTRLRTAMDHLRRAWQG